MSASARNEPVHPTDAGESFRPTARLATLRRRAELLETIRSFLRTREYWEVDTPLLSQDTCVDAHIDPIEVRRAGRACYLQTSPEFAMKRLLAAGSGSIFQMGHVFRDDERGALHNVEFTLVEWYKVEADIDTLMDEIRVLITSVLDAAAPTTVSYRDAFIAALGMDPLAASDEALAAQAKDRGFLDPASDRVDLLNFLWADGVEPSLGASTPQFVIDYPADMAALAETHVDEHGDVVAGRFELYMKGIEICNGYQELTDPAEMIDRFRKQNEIRTRRGKPRLPIQSRLLDAMNAGLPRCAGVALGFDRLFMLVVGADRIDEVLPFPEERA